jgi:hypothetical protein
MADDTVGVQRSHVPWLPFSGEDATPSGNHRSGNLLTLMPVRSRLRAIRAAPSPTIRELLVNREF